jgi:hypothetical protein
VPKQSRSQRRNCLSFKLGRLRNSHIVKARCNIHRQTPAAGDTTVPRTAESATAISSAACPSCKHENPEGSKYCNACGLVLQAAPDTMPPSPVRLDPSWRDAYVTLGAAMANVLPERTDVANLHSRSFAPRTVALRGSAKVGLRGLRLVTIVVGAVTVLLLFIGFVGKWPAAVREDTLTRPIEIESPPGLATPRAAEGVASPAGARRPKDDNGTNAAAALLKPPAVASVPAQRGTADNVSPRSDGGQRRHRATTIPRASDPEPPRYRPPAPCAAGVAALGLCE